MSTSTDIVQLIDEAHEKSKEPQRAYLGASQVGQPCRRAIWFSYRWASVDEFPGRMLRLFRHGYAYEPLFIEDLRKIGYTVITKHRKTGKNIGFSDMDGHFKGHVDGIAKEPDSDEWVLLEFKTHSEKSFKKLEKDKVKKSKPQHYAQMQIYMHYMKLQRALYLAVNKNTDNLYAEWIDYSDEDATHYINRAGTVIHSDIPLESINTDEKSFDCKFCNHNEVCYKKKLPQFSCRTCKYSQPDQNGLWVCHFSHAPGKPAPWTLDINAQRRGCEYHEFIPALMEGIEEPKEKILPNDIDWYIHDMQKTFGAKIVKAE